MPKTEPSVMSNISATQELIKHWQEIVSAASQTVGHSSPFEHADVPMLLPTEVFVNLTGEEMRARLLETALRNGKTLCLRPDFTIALVHTYAEAINATTALALTYSGKIFRQQKQNQPPETLQLGVETICPKNVALKQEADCFNLGYEVLKATHQKPDTIILGDQDLFDIAIGELNISPLLSETLKTLARQHTSADEFISALQSKQALSRSYIARYGAYHEADRAERIAEDIKQQGAELASRTKQDIIERINMQIAHDQALKAIDADLLRQLHTLAAFKSPLKDLQHRLSQDVEPLGLNAKQAVDELLTFAHALNADAQEQTQFQLFFQRPFTYYQGRVFDAYTNSQPRPIWGGGRYDKLLSHITGAHDKAAVGFALWPERFTVSQQNGGEK